MGPRSADRGNGLDAGGLPILTALQWGRDQLIAEICSLEPAASPAGKLQWGRDQLIAEIRASALHSASTASLQWGRDQLIAEISDPLSYSVFNDLSNALRAALTLSHSSGLKLTAVTHHAPAVSSAYELASAPRYLRSTLPLAPISS